MTADFVILSLLQKGEKSTKIKRKLAILGYFANAQYDKIYRYDKKDKTNLLANFSLFFCEFYNFARKLK